MEKINLTCEKILEYKKNYYFLFIKFKNLKELPLDVNPRLQKTKGKIYKAIVNSATDTNADDNNFVLLNRGLTITASKIEIIGNSICLYFDNSYDGIIDGGHTHLAIMQKNYEKDKSNKILKIELLVGFDETNDNIKISDISLARNTSEQVWDLSIAEVNGGLDFIKKELEREDYYKFIAWKQNQDIVLKKNLKDQKQKDLYKNVLRCDILIQLFTIFNIESYNCNQFPLKHPIISYSGKNACVKKFLELTQDKNLESSPFYKMRKLFKDIIKLYSEINVGYNSVLKVLHKKVSKNNSSRIFEIKGKGRCYLDIKKSYLFSNALIFPILNIFRQLIEEKKNNFCWKDGVDVFKIWKEIKSEIVKQSYSYFQKDCKSNTIECGKRVSVWECIYRLGADLIKDKNLINDK